MEKFLLKRLRIFVKNTSIISIQIEIILTSLKRRL